MNDDTRLNELLNGWMVQPLESQTFQHSVWDRIGSTAYQRAGIAHVVGEWVAARFLNPIFSTATVAVIAFSGLILAHVTAARTIRHTQVLQVRRYLVSVDPISRAEQTFGP